LWATLNLHTSYRIGHIAIASCRLRQTASDSSFVEEFRKGEGDTSYIDAEPAVYRFSDFMSANRAVFPSFDEATLVIR